MIGYGRWQGERLSGRQAGGLAVALAGLVGLLLPGLSAPPLQGSVLMIGRRRRVGRLFPAREGQRRSAAGHRRQLHARGRAGRALSVAMLPAASLDAPRRRLCDRVGRARLGRRLCDLVQRAARPQRDARRDGAAQRAGDRGARRRRLARRAADPAAGRRVDRDPRRHRVGRDRATAGLSDGRRRRARSGAQATSSASTSRRGRAAGQLLLVELARAAVDQAQRADQAAVGRGERRPA